MTTININGSGSSLLWKGIITGILILAMLIPTVFVMNLVEERKERQKEVIAEVSSKWADSQVLSGPFLIIPYSFQQKVDAKETVTITQQLVVLPDQLDAVGSITPQIKRRSIYQVALYQSSLQLQGRFDLKSIIPGAGETIQWKDAILCLGISDTRGIVSQVTGSWNGAPVVFDAGIPDNSLVTRGMSVPIDLTAVAAQGAYSFNIPVKLKGSEALQLLPLGKSTTFNIQSPWESPSFIGKFLPEYKPNEKGFNAKWQVLHFNRDFPQVWKNQVFKATEFAFGVSLIQPADNYAKTLRSVKYAILFIGLTFGFFYLLEIMLGRRVHPVQYVLVGLALVVFYTLLLSLGEILTFNIAYLIATSATVTLIGLYAKQMFGTWKNGLSIAGFLAGLYTFIYILIQLEDTALLAGSVGLFVLVAVAMHFSRKIDWYGNNAKEVVTE